MGRETLVEAAPLLTGTLRNRRQEVKTNLIEFVLSLDEVDENSSVSELSEIANSELGVELDEASIVGALDNLVDKGDIEYISGDKFRIIDRPEIETFSELIEPVWKEFSDELKEKDKDVDVGFIDDEIEEAFKNFLYKFFQIVLESSEEMSEFEIDSLETIDFESVIDEIIQEYNVDRDELFKNTLKEYIQNPGECLTEFTEKAYTGIINYNIIRRGEETIEFELEADNKQIFLDTNVLVALLCETDNFHPIITSALRRARHLDYDIYYLPKTASELESLIGGSRHELEEFRESGRNKDVVDSQFVKDYLRRDLSYEEYIDLIFNNWRERLESKGVVEYSKEFKINKELYEIAEETIKKIERVKEQYNSEIKPPHKIDHDAKLLTLVAQTKEEAENPNLGPFVVSFDATVTTVGNLRETGSGKEVSLHPRSLLEYILAFSPVEIEEDSRGDVAVALLKSATNFEETLDIDEYAKLLRPRIGLDEGQEELLARILTESDRYTDLEEALEENRGDEADEIAIEILSDDTFLRELSEEWALKEEMREAARTVEKKEEEVSKFRRKYKNEREMRETFQSLLQNSGDSNVFIDNRVESKANSTSESTSKATAEAQAKSVEKFSKEVDNFIDTLEIRLENGIEMSEIPSPPEDTTDVDETREWLQRVTAGIASGGIVKGGEALLPWAQELLDKAIELGGA
jgi:predicted nucleic acid-binding protein